MFFEQGHVLEEVSMTEASRQQHGRDSEESSGPQDRVQGSLTGFSGGIGKDTEVVFGLELAVMRGSLEMGSLCEGMNKHVP